MRKYLTTNTAGLTLIELLLYLALTTSMVLVLGSIGVNLLFSREKNIALDDVRYTADFVFNKITETLNHSEYIEAPDEGATSTELVLQVSDALKNPTVLSVVDGVVYIREGDSLPVALSTERLYVSSLVFTRMITGDNPETVRIHVGIGSRDTHSSERDATTKDFFTTFHRTLTP